MPELERKRMSHRDLAFQHGCFQDLHPANNRRAVSTELQRDVDQRNVHLVGITRCDSPVVSEPELKIIVSPPIYPKP